MSPESTVLDEEIESPGSHYGIVLRFPSGKSGLISKEEFILDVTGHSRQLSRIGRGIGILREGRDSDAVMEMAEFRTAESMALENLPGT